MRLTILVLLAIAPLKFSRSAAPSTESAVPLLTSEIAATYYTLQKITKDPVPVDLALTGLCVIGPQLTEEALRRRFGPHAHASIHIYMNDLAATAFRTRSRSYPVGAIVVKEKEMRRDEGPGKPQAKPERSGVGGMVKRSLGYDPKNGDWEYFYFENVERVESGRISTCVACHASAKENDHVFGTWVRGGG